MGVVYMKFKRICKICKKEFETSCHNKTVCYIDHHHNCPVCGKDVICNDPNRQDCTCSRECGRIIAQKSRVKTYKRKYNVDSLGKLPATRKATIERNKSHKKIPIYSKCIVCGKQIKLRWPYDPDKQKTCSTKCRSIYIKESGISKARTKKAKETLEHNYGVSNPSELQHFKKICPYCLKEFETDSARRIYCYDRHKGKCPVCGKLVYIDDMSIGPQACSEECRQKRIENTCLIKYGDKCAVNSDHGRDAARTTNISKHGVPHYSQTREYHVKCARTRFDVVASDGIHLDSKYELALYEFAKSLGLTIEYQIPFSYFYNIDRKLFIDFRIDDMLFECKGGHLISGHYSKDLNHTKFKFQLYKKFGAILVTDSIGFSNIQSHDDETVRSLVCVDVELFRTTINLQNSLIWKNLKYLINSGLQFITIDDVINVQI